MAIFRFFKMAAAAILDFNGRNVQETPPPCILKFQISNSRKGQEGRTASACQISSKSVKPSPRDGDFSIFQNGGRHHLGFFTRLEAMASAEYWIHFMVRFDGVHAFGYNSAGSEPIWMKFGAL